MNGTICFSSFVFGSYEKYIPYYIYSIWKTHPNAFIKVFIEKPLTPKIFEVLECLKREGLKNFEVILWLDSCYKYGSFKIKGGGNKLIRWFIDQDYFEDFDYVYIGDIDILFLPEEKSLMDFHVTQMLGLHLPFSNKVRLKNNGDLSERLTGLHFFKTKEYYEKIGPIISQIKSDKFYRDVYLKGLERDENFLYKLNREAFDFDPELLAKAQRPWHGLHLGITRGNKNLDIQTIEENSSLSIEEVKNHLLGYLKDSVFKKIQRKVFVIELEAILKELNIPYSFSWKYKGLKYRALEKWRFSKRRIKDVLK